MPCGKTPQFFIHRPHQILFSETITRRDPGEELDKLGARLGSLIQLEQDSLILRNSRQILRLVSETESR
jgi:hypothetical protein